MITEYHRPLTLVEAITLASDPNAVVISGGTTLTSRPAGSASIVVDLQGLDLAGVEAVSGGLRIGATTRLQDLVESEDVPTLLADLAQREAPITMRNVATVGGTIAAANPESQLLTGLLAFDARVTIAGDGSTSVHSIGELLADASLLAGSIITSISIPIGGTAAADRTARTPRDQPIVMAVAHRGSDGNVRLAMSGVAPLPLVVDPNGLDDLDPPSDFRGSSDYRRQVAAVLAGRVLAIVGGGQ